MIPVCTQEALQLLHEGSLVFSRMEANGIRVDAEYLERTIKECYDKIDTLVQEMKKDKIYKKWHRRFGQRTNIDSHRQLATVLFEVMGYESNTRTATGKMSTSADALEDLELDFVYKFQDVQHLKTKTIRTYLNGLKREMVRHGKHYYIHPFFNLHTAATYRSSANDPNVHNFPERNPEMANLIQPSLLGNPGDVIVKGDFSQLEVRIAQCYHKDPVMDRYIRDTTTDMHGDTAQKLFKIPKELYKKFKDYFKKTIRDSSKNQFVFPQFYGSVYANCAKNIWKAMARRDFRVGPDGIPMRDHLAEHGITERGDCIVGEQPRKGTFEYLVKEVENYFWNEQFTVYTEWKRDWVDLYRKRGWFKMLSGFVVKYGIYSRNDVINYPVQGSAFHCLLWCLIKIDKWIRKYKMRSRLINEIHDSLVASVHPAELQDFLSYCHHVMTVELPKHWTWINVPLAVEFEVTEPNGHWRSAKGWTQQEGGLWALKA